MSIRGRRRAVDHDVRCQVWEPAPSDGDDELVRARGRIESKEEVAAATQGAAFVEQGVASVAASGRDEVPSRADVNTAGSMP